ncbi:MAG: GDSL-type esterase/lipase family protein [Desulfurivibrionaceae bacterium]|nr:GDSL-type esterase/lipase family protein [Desulfobulbales bacterium]MDT8334961.1 GDSL-type esterase/lipase family protein [Desulfurivibrionaceae bacterium]
MADKFQKLMLVGDSMIEFFDWQARFPGRKVRNLGRAGESVEELRFRAAAIVERHEPPSLVLVMIGTNNVAMEDFNFQGAYADILATFKNAYPEATLVVNSLLPMKLNYLAPDTVARVNSSLKSLAGGAGARYLEIWAAMVDHDGVALEGILEDEVHLTPRGYEIWADQLERFLEG